MWYRNCTNNIDFNCMCAFFIGAGQQAKITMKQIVGELNYLGYFLPDLSNRTKPNKKPIEPNRTPIVRLGWAIEQNRTPILL